MSLLALVMAAAAVAGADAPATATAQDQAVVVKAPDKALTAPDPERVVCRKEQVTGSRFYKRVCLTQEQWDAQTAQAERNQQRISQRTGLGSAMGGGGFTGQ
jgi:hypothetical protein